MNLEQAEKIYKHPKGHSKAELTECLKILNSQPRRLSILEQVVIADAHNRLDILNGVIDAEYTIKDKPKLLKKRRSSGRAGESHQS